MNLRSTIDAHWACRVTGLPTEARRVASHMNSPSTGEQQSSQDGESAFKSRAVRHWEAPCEPQLLSKVSTHPPELAPVRTGKAWEKADELDLDNASPYRSPGSGIQFSARSAVIAEGVVAFERFPTPVTAPDYDCCCQPLDSTSGAQHGLNGDTITVDAVASPADSAVPRSIHRQPPPPTSTATSTARYPPPPPALQRLRDCRLSARAHHEGRNALGVTRTSALTALRKRREHAAASKAAECEQMNLCSSTSEVHVDNDPASQPTNHSTSFQTDSGACTVQQKRVRVAPLTDALWSSAGHIRAHATRDRPHGSMELHHDRVSDSNERSEGLAGAIFGVLEETHCVPEQTTSLQYACSAARQSKRLTRLYLSCCRLTASCTCRFPSRPSAAIHQLAHSWLPTSRHSHLLGA